MQKILILLLLLFSVSLRGQNLDSLEVLTINKDTTAVRAMNQLYRQYFNSNPRMALDYTIKALDLSLALSYEKGVASCYNNIGLFYKNQGLLEKAVSYYLQSLSINKRLKNIEGIAFTYNNIGTIYSLKNDYANALRYFLDSYNLLDSIGNKKAMVGALNNLGNTYLAKEEDYRAIGFYKRALRIYAEHKDNNNFDPYANIGHAYFLHGELNRAISYYEQSLVSNESKGDINGMAYAYHNLAIINLAKNNKTDDALNYELKALKAAEQVLNNDLLKEIHKSLSNIYENLGNTGKAYEHLKLFVSFEELLLNEKSNDQLAQMETTYLLMEKDKQLALVSKENEINKLRADNSKTVVIIAIMGAMIIFGALYTYYTYNRRYKKTA